MSGSAVILNHIRKQANVIAKEFSKKRKDIIEEKYFPLIERYIVESEHIVCEEKALVSWLYQKVDKASIDYIIPFVVPFSIYSANVRDDSDAIMGILQKAHPGDIIKKQSKANVYITVEIYDENVEIMRFKFFPPTKVLTHTLPAISVPDKTITVVDPVIVYHDIYSVLTDPITGHRLWQNYLLYYTLFNSFYPLRSLSIYTQYSRTGGAPWHPRTRDISLSQHFAPLFAPFLGDHLQWRAKRDQRSAPQALIFLGAFGASLYLNAVHDDTPALPYLHYEILITDKDTLDAFLSNVRTHREYTEKRVPFRHQEKYIISYSAQGARGAKGATGGRPIVEVFYYDELCVPFQILPAPMPDGKDVPLLVGTYHVLLRFAYYSLWSFAVLHTQGLLGDFAVKKMNILFTLIETMGLIRNKYMKKNNFLGLEKENIFRIFSLECKGIKRDELKEFRKIRWARR